MEEPFSAPPTIADIEKIAREALAGIPEGLRRHVADVVLLVEDFPDGETQDAMGLRDPFELLGLYHGVSLDQKSVSCSPQDIDRIYLYRRPLLDMWCETGEDLVAIVRNTIIHEVGHHFGFSDADMERLEYGGDGG